jgi:alkylation response protein AidB-like acyl-CoA dehydrogenase
MYADYFLTLVKDEAAGGQTLLVIPRGEGLSTKHMKMSGSGSAGTAFVEFDDVSVPVENVVGQRGQAFKYIVSNFNHEVSISVGRFHTANLCSDFSLAFNRCDVHACAYRMLWNMRKTESHSERS